MKAEVSPETLEALAKISKAAGGTGAIHLTAARICDNCEDDDKEAFPYGVYDATGKYWEDLCNECFDLLGCRYPAPQQEKGVMTKEELGETVAFHKKFNDMVNAGILFAIARERLYQDRKYGTPAQRQLSVANYLLIMRKELDEAMNAMVEEGFDQAMMELLQVVAVGVAAMEQYGAFERPDVGRKVFL